MTGNDPVQPGGEGAKRFDSIRQAIENPELAAAELAKTGARIGELGLRAFEEALGQNASVFVPVVRTFKAIVAGEEQLKAAVASFCEKVVDRMAELSKGGHADKAEKLLGGLANLIRQSSERATLWEEKRERVVDWRPMFFDGLHHSLSKGAGLDLSPNVAANLFDFAAGTLRACTAPEYKETLNKGLPAAQLLAAALPLDRQGGAAGKLGDIEREAETKARDRDIERKLRLDKM
jgi:hypothetical protein